ncbi:hypothetical protein [Roseitranquillus sediminis]|uniref:hypothetical protein n=1 Tax=Roseitranquillus sediminis TaxID=2809051 RepID=UPI001D0C5EA1|nr:hypothetical protein [Roseitranquillus sediminis]MBM9594461.1 hypothetical protein [Roseitranquillus sediminis]
MDSIAGLPFVRLKFDKNGARMEPDAPVRPSDIENLIVISHGWKNNEAAADGLYRQLIENMRNLPDGERTLDDGRFGVTGVYWPAFVFKPDLTLLEDEAPTAGGGAASAGGSDLPSSELETFAEEVAAFVEIDDVTSFKEQVKRATGGGGAADRLAERLRDEVPTEGADAEAIFEQEGRDKRGSELFDFLRTPPALPQAAGDQGAAVGFGGSAPGRLRFLAGPRAAVARLLNQFTYFEMKKRAGLVGAALARTLEADGLDTVGLHLIGHSFGARLVTSAVSHLERIQPRSMTLLQAAYSHNALGIGKGRVPQGMFRNVVASQRVTGPIAITHTHNDRAVGIAYVVASRASGVVAARFGGPTDPFGGMGANGAQLLQDGEAVMATLTAGQTQMLKPKLINNLLADAVIADHNDVTNTEVARVALQAIRHR